MSFKDHLCTSKKMHCVRNIKIKNSSCMKPCSGFIVNSLYKSEQIRNLEKLFPVFGAYNHYKKVTPNPQGYDGKNFNTCNFLPYIIQIHFRVCMEKQSEICEDLF